MLEAAGEAIIICALLLPRYVKRLCCNNEAHMVNWPEEDFPEILRNGGEACQNILKTEGEKYGLSIATFNPLSCFGQADDLAEILSSAGLSIWREDDLLITYSMIPTVLCSVLNSVHKPVHNSTGISCCTLSAIQ